MWPAGTLADGCSLMLYGSVKPMWSIARAGSLLGMAHSAGKLATGDTGLSTKSNGWLATTAMAATVGAMLVSV